MNLVQINTTAIGGGAAKVALDLHRQFLEKNYTSHLLVGRSPHPHVSQNVSVLTQPDDSWLHAKVANGIGIQEFSLYRRNLLANPIIKQAEVVLLHNLHGKYFHLNDLSQLQGKKLFWVLHDMWPLTGHCAYSFGCKRFTTGCGSCPHLKVYPKLRVDLTNQLLKRKQKLYQNLDFEVIVPSEWLQKQTQDSILQNKPTHLIYNGVDTNVFKPASHHQVAQLRKKLQIPPDKRVLLIAGSHKAIAKGGRYFRKLVARMETQPDWVILHLGGAQQLTRTNNLIKLPYVSDERILAKYYSMSDIYVLTSIAENCPLVVLEAQACGTPVVAFGVGGVPELIKHKHTGWLATAKDVEGLLEGLEFLGAKTSTRQQACRKWVEKRFRLDQQVEGYLEVIGS